MIASNIETLAKSKDEAKKDFTLGLETVIMEDNFSDIPELVKFAAEKDVDYILASHVVSYTPEIFAKPMYLTLSKPTIALKFNR